MILYYVYHESSNLFLLCTIFLDSLFWTGVNYAIFLIIFFRGSGMEGGEEQTEKVVMQFDQEQLFSLYNQLEQIQEQLDALR